MKSATTKQIACSSECRRPARERILSPIFRNQFTVLPFITGVGGSSTSLLDM